MLMMCFGIPSSLSESYYILEKESKDLGALFYLFLLITVFVLVIPMIEATGFWGFICGAGLLFVGAAPAFKSDDQKYIHIIGAAVSAISAFIQLIVMHKLLCLLPVIVIVTILSLVTKTYKSSLVFWLEMIAFYSLFPGLILFYI